MAEGGAPRDRELLRELRGRAAFAPPPQQAARPDGDQLAGIGELLQAERIRPVIDRVFPFEQAKEALEYLAQGRSRGKVVVKVR